MTLENKLLAAIDRLPTPLQQEVLDFAEFLAIKHTDTLNDTRKKRSGSLKGTFVLPLPADFDEPLADFEDYMA